MTTVFKSDMKATASMDNFTGYMGAADWYKYADFSNDDYRNNSNSKIALSDVLTSPSQQSYETLIDKIGNVSKSAANMPRRSFIPAHGVFGIVHDWNLTSVYSNSAITIAAGLTYALYATKGTVVFDKSLVTVLSGTGKLSDPYLIKYKATANIVVNKDRYDAIVVCVKLSDNRVPISIVGEGRQVFDGDINVNIAGVNKTQFTIVMRVVSPKIGEGVLPATSGFMPIVKFYQDTTNTVSYVKQRNFALKIRALRSGVVSDAEELAPVAQTVDTYAISMSSGVITHYMNGVKINVPERIQGAAFTLNELKVLSNDTQWSVYSTGAALLNLIIYNRALSASELSKCVFV